MLEARPQGGDATSPRLYDRTYFGLYPYISSSFFYLLRLVLLPRDGGYSISFRPVAYWSRAVKLANKQTHICPLSVTRDFRRLMTCLLPPSVLYQRF